MTPKFNYFFNQSLLHVSADETNNSFKGFHKSYEWFINDSRKFQFFSINSINSLTLFYKLAIWGKARVIYYVNNWIYTTNHKRIAVNYFWFVIFSGICGMVLATIIRLEMAYPGVGILAGDSLQYLSVVTAHAVIMVFFMIMPLMFGAFGNFLLPTQLGVHDVAFPRLNSAAFWFLPAGLIMLCQLVCLDRRYQRMNCFNIREVQALLKGRFFSDLANTHDHHEFLNKTTIGIRFKTNNLDSITPNMLLFYKNGVHSNNQTRSQSYFSSISSFNQYEFFNTNSKLAFFVNYFNVNLNYSPIKVIFNYYSSIITMFNLNAWNYYDNVTGNSTLQSVIHASFNFLKTELKRNLRHSLNIINFNEPSWLFVNYYTNYLPMYADNLMYGWMDNNIGFHKNRQVIRPKHEHPDVVTGGSLPEFVFTFLYSIASRSLLIPVRNFKLNLDVFVNRWSVRFQNVANNQPTTTLNVDTQNIIESFEKNNFNNHTSKLSLFFQNSISLLVNILVNVYVTGYTTVLTILNFNINLTLYVNTFYNCLNHLLSLNVFLGFNNFTNLVTNLNTQYLTNHNLNQVVASNNVEYLTKNWNSLDLNNQTLFNNVETSLNYRYQRFSNPIFRYDYKAGNYITKQDKEAFPYLFTTKSPIHYVRSRV